MKKRNAKISLFPSKFHLFLCASPWDSGVFLKFPIGRSGCSPCEPEKKCQPSVICRRYDQKTISIIWAYFSRNCRIETHRGGERGHIGQLGVTLQVLNNRKPLTVLVNILSTGTSFRWHHAYVNRGSDQREMGSTLSKIQSREQSNAAQGRAARHTNVIHLRGTQTGLLSFVSILTRRLGSFYPRV